MPTPQSTYDLYHSMLPVVEEERWVCEHVDSDYPDRGACGRSAQWSGRTWVSGPQLLSTDRTFYCNGHMDAHRAQPESDPATVSDPGGGVRAGTEILTCTLRRRESALTLHIKSKMIEEYIKGATRGVRVATSERHAGVRLYQPARAHMAMPPDLMQPISQGDGSLITAGISGSTINNFWPLIMVGIGEQAGKTLELQGSYSVDSLRRWARDLDKWGRDVYCKLIAPADVSLTTTVPRRTQEG